MLRIVLSGPKSAATQARNALAGAGLDVHATEHDHGLPATVSGKDIRQAQAFVTVHGDDVDRAHEAVAPLGWRLRMHFETPEPAPPSPAQALADGLADYERRLFELEAQVQALRAGTGLPAIGGGAVETPPFALQASTYGAEQTRRTIASVLQRGASIGSIAGGLVAASDCQLTPPGSGMTVNVAPGEAWVPGSTSATQSGYYCRVSSSTSLTIAASNASNPRVDTVVAQVQDAAYSGATNSFQVAVVTGTATAGATLANLLGRVRCRRLRWCWGMCWSPQTRRA